MTGKKRYAVRFMALAAVLAAGGAGAYHYTSGEGPLWNWLRPQTAQDQSATLSFDEEPLPPPDAEDSELNAAAQAWAQSAAPRYGAAESSRPIATQSSQGVALVSAQSESPTPSGGRYNRYDDAPGTHSATDLSTGRYGSAIGLGDEAARHSDDGDEVVQLIATEEGSDPYHPVDDSDTPYSNRNLEESLPHEANEPARLDEIEDPIPIDGSSNHSARAPSQVLPAEASLAHGQDSGQTDDTGSESDEQGDSQTAGTPYQNEAPSYNFEAEDFDLPENSEDTNDQYATGAQRARQAFNDDESPSTTAEQGFHAASAMPRENTTAGAPGETVVNPFTRGANPMQNSTNASGASGASLAGADGGSPNQALPGAGQEVQPLVARPSAPNRFSGAAGSYGDLPSGDLAPALSGRQLDQSTDSLTAMPGTGRPGERALEGPQNPSLVIQKLAPPEIQVGKLAKFLIQVRNVGGQAAAEVAIQDEVPQGTQLVSTSPQAEINGGKLLWQLGTLSIGEERTVEMQLRPVSEGDLGSVATVTYSAQASVKTRSTMPQLAIRMTAPKEVMIGQEQRVKIELANPGTGDATGVVLHENVPENLRHEAGQALEFEIGTLRAGETRELELILLAEKPGTVVNILTARAEGNLQVQQQVEFEVIAPALAVSVDGPDRRYLERPATYEVRVENPGTAPARNVQLVTKLPKGMRFIRANNLGEYDAATHAVYWSLAELPEGERGAVELVAMPIETGQQSLEVEGRAQQGLSDRTSQQIVVEGLAAILFEVRDLEDPIEVGKETAYEIRVVNQGTKSAKNVQVVVGLPQAMKVVSAEGETRHSVQPGGIVFAPIRELAPKADTLFRLRVQCLRAGDQRLTVDVNTDDLSQPIRKEESTRVFGDE